MILVLGWVFPVSQSDAESSAGKANMATPMPPGKLDRDTLKSHNPSVLWAKTAGRLELVRQDAKPDVLRVSYPAGGWGSKHSGAQIKFALPPTQTKTVQYRVRFANDFDFVKGGKLPGLAGGSATTGKRRPTGDGWSARFMWRRGGDAVLYLYHLDQRKSHGDDFALGVRFKPGVWHTIKQRVTVNSDQERDGRIEVWFDQAKVLDASSLRLQSDNQAPVDRFYFSTFFGGTGDEWAPKQDQVIDFADFKTL
nr:heparin lyase I family protein [Rubripirellula obstinata]